MTTTPMDSTAGTPRAWVLHRTDPGGEEVMPGDEAAAGESGLGFGDLLDVLNPLQHLPVVGTLYRALTGDTISDAARMAGGALYGGPFGLVGALANVVVEKETGHDIGDTALAWLGEGAGTGADDGSMVADVAPAPPETAAQPINAAPVTTAAAFASPAALAMTAAAATPPATPPATAIGQTAVPVATTAFQGRSADRLDAFIRQASAVRRPAPLPGAAEAARLQAASLKPPGVTTGAERRDGPDAKRNEAEIALAGGDAGSVNDWMLRALDKYEHMRKQETS